MVKTRVLRKRRKAVRNIRKITRTMQLISTARFQKSFQRTVATHPYTAKVEEILSDLSSLAGQVSHPLLGATKPGKDAPSMVLVMTSNRGLCGGYNANLLRLSLDRIRKLQAEATPVRVEVTGKKGLGYFNFLKIPVAASHQHLAEKVTLEAAHALAESVIRSFSAGELRSVHVVYTKFISAGVQRPTVAQLLPFQRPEAEPGKSTATAVQYDFSPDPEELLNELLPAAVKARLFQCLLDAATSEQVARMVAMKAATDAAADMIKAIGSQYNRARQTGITTELMEIIAGSAAMD